MQDPIFVPPPESDFHRSWARGFQWATLVLSGWLFISAFAWRHTSIQATNTWIVAVICGSIAMMAMTSPVLRYLNTLASIWLFISAFAIPSVTGGTVWNNVLVAIGIFILSIAGDPMLPVSRMHRGPVS